MSQNTAKAILREALFELASESGMSHSEISLSVKPTQPGYLVRKLEGDRELRTVDLDLILNAIGRTHADLFGRCLIVEPREMTRERVVHGLCSAASRKRYAVERAVIDAVKRAKKERGKLSELEEASIAVVERARQTYPGLVEALSAEKPQMSQISEEYELHRTSLSRIRRAMLDAGLIHDTKE